MTFCISHLVALGEWSRRYHEHVTNAVTTPQSPLPEREKAFDFTTILLHFLGLRQHANRCCLATPHYAWARSARKRYFGRHSPCVWLSYIASIKSRFVTA